MKRTLFVCGMVVIVLLAGVNLVQGAATPESAQEQAAQTGGTLPPTIISFTSDVESISLADAEAGETAANLSWITVGVTDQYRVAIYSYRLNAWEWLLPADDQPLPSSGSAEITIQHPLNFGPPTYSLMIMQGQTLIDQRTLTVDYAAIESETDPAVDPTASAPRIVNFAGGMPNLEAYTVADGSARIFVTWQIANRPPNSNLVFEQVLEGGRAVSAELPRASLWVPSEGNGVLAPVMPPTGLPVQLRMRLVNMENGSTLVEQALDPITLTGPNTAPPPVVNTPVPAPQGSTAPGVQIVSFTAVPEVVARGGTVTVYWQVSGVNQVGVSRLEPGGPIAEQAPVSSPTGSWTVALPSYHVDRADFIVSAFDPAGNLVQGALTVQVICPFVYFFGDPGAGVPCPLDEGGTVQAAYQAFEGGVMIWRADTSDIYVLFNSGSVSRFKDTWTDENISVPETPPAGLYQPVRGFGKVWVSDQYVRNALGWATTLEQGYTMQYQISGALKYARHYMSMPDGSVFYLVENSWTYK
ncbi:MAG: hypothetical protein HY866_22270 [Chloroflexi bacterium]|nr:hypothetical protein [Chloroflexota bacterium]